MSENKEHEDLTSDELMAAAWAVEHLEQKHGYSSIVSRDGGRVQLSRLLDRLTALAALESRPPVPVTPTPTEDEREKLAKHLCRREMPENGDLNRAVEHMGKWRRFLSEADDILALGIGSPRPSADVVEATNFLTRELKDGFLNENVVARGSLAYRHLESVIAAARLSSTPVETEEWEWIVRSTSPDSPLAPSGTWDTEPTDEETARAIFAWEGPILRELLRRRPAGPWLPVTEEKK